jgi:imidazolonepropionase-like amidohydrolase
MLAIRAAHLFDGERFWPGPATVLTNGPTVLGIEPGHRDLPAGTAVLDPGDTTVLPGLIDSHTHLVGDSRDGALDRVAGYPAEQLAAVVAESLRTQLASGVTVVRDLGDRDWVAVAHRDRQRACSGATGTDPADEPTVLASGPPITSPGGHCYAMGGEVSGPDEIARAVRERADRRVDVVKVMASGGMTSAGTDVLGTQFSDDDLTFLVHEAHRHGLPVTAHAHSLPAVEQALAAEVDGLEHASCLTERGFRMPDAVLGLLAERQIPVDAALGSPPVAAFAQAPAAVRAQFERTGLTPEVFRDARLAIIRRMHEAGVLFLAGRDSGISSFLTHGSIWDSIAFYIDAGAPTTVALAAATSAAADACGVGDRRGRIRPGSAADLLLVGGDARADVARLADVRVVIRAGTPVAGHC